MRRFALSGLAALAAAVFCFAGGAAASTQKASSNHASVVVAPLFNGANYGNHNKGDHNCNWIRDRDDCGPPPCKGDKCTPPPTPSLAPASPSQQNDAFVCYNANGLPEEPNVGEATAMLLDPSIDGLRWAPYWVPGNVDPATGENLGGGHLSCSLPAGKTWDGKTLANSEGELFDGSGNGDIVNGIVDMGGVYPAIS